MYFKQPRQFRNPTGRIITGILICCFVDSLLNLVGRALISDGELGVGCRIQAVLVQWNHWVEWLLGLAITLYTFLVISNRSIVWFHRWESTILSMAILIPLPLAIFFLFSYPNGKDPLIGDADLWCWISTRNYSPFQLYFAFLPLVVLSTIELGVIIWVTRRLGQMQKSIKVKSYQPYRNFIISRMLAHFLAFCITWLPTIINRFWTATTGQLVNELLLVQAATYPMQGMFQFLVYIYTWYISPLNRKGGFQEMGQARMQQREDEFELDPEHRRYQDYVESLHFDPETDLNTALNGSGSIPIVVIQHDR
jgi:hypothetical protein